MECKECGRKLAKNGIKKGVQYYYCTHCKKSYSGKPHEPNHHIFEEYIARLLYRKCVICKNEFTQTTWTINQIARLLGHHHRDISKWVANKIPHNLDKTEFANYIKNRHNGYDIACVLGYTAAIAPSANLNKIIKRKERPITAKNRIGFHINEFEYLRLVNMPITNRKEAIFILGALLGCRTSEIVGAKYSNINYDEMTIHFNCTVTFSKQIDISENNRCITNRIYPLTQRMLTVIEWLKTYSERNKEKSGENYNNFYPDFLCVQENGTPLNSFTLNRRTQDIQDKVPITTEFTDSWLSINNVSSEKIRSFQFKWLRYSVKLMMIKAGVSKDDIKTIFGYKKLGNGENQLEIMRNAYALLDKYIDEQTNKRNS